MVFLTRGKQDQWTSKRNFAKTHNAELSPKWQEGDKQWGDKII